MNLLYGLMALGGAIFFTVQVWKGIAAISRGRSDRKLFERIRQVPGGSIHMFQCGDKITYQLHAAGQVLGGNDLVPAVTVYEIAGFSRYQIFDEEGALRAQYEENTSTGKTQGNAEARSLARRVKTMFMESMPLHIDASHWQMVSETEACWGEWSLKKQLERDDNECLLELYHEGTGVHALASIYESNILSDLWTEIQAANQQATGYPD